MKYHIHRWGPPSNIAHSAVTISPVDRTLMASNLSKHIENKEALIVFYCNNDPYLSKRQEALATKVCAYLVELEEKITMVEELMSIAAADKKEK